METASFLSKAAHFAALPLSSSSSSSSSCRRSCKSTPTRRRGLVVSALERNNSNSNTKKALPNSNYVIPLDKSSCITRPLAEILRDLNKRVPDNIIKPDDNDIYIPWYHANRMLSFYAPGTILIILCGSLSWFIVSLPLREFWFCIIIGAVVAMF
eukprot:TRINITY_DN9628_c0_g1_i2.p1 TRINITY_DN9628_c0_g1~~TRINITY_DN9628_c0_g1_i2.p1  ORF type:complete len:155 (+),score=2.82 TRINITY_DN9628_c0_g1_i2:175-639(+)